MTYVIALFCVLGLAAGQILFKLSASAVNKAGTVVDQGAMIYFLIALTLYGVTTIGWVWVLQKTELGKIYPLMALAFVVVPLASHFLLGERFQPQYFIGIALIIAGIVVSAGA
jgi:drug/metabolite transporter (DMT)-like permease